MSAYQFTPQAESDLFEVWQFIANDVSAANKVEAAIHDACALLASAPVAGHVRSDVTDLPLRLPYSRYIIVYDPADRPLRVIRIVHGARNIAAILAGR